MRSARRRLAALGGALVALLAIAGTAAAHAQLVASSPAPGEVLEAPPAELRLTFSEPLEGGFSSADLADADGAPIVSRAGAVDAADPFTLVVPLPELAAGVYTVTWQSLSTADGHPARGFFTFGVGSVELPGTVSGQERAGADPADPIGLYGKWLAYLAMLLGAGVPLFAAAVLRDARLRGRVAAALGGLLVAAALVLLLLAVRLPLSQGDPLATYLLGSRGGLLALVRSGVLLAGGAAVLLLARRGGTAVALRVAAAAAIVGIGLHVATGHAAALGSPVPVLVQVVHLLAAATWLSGVVGLAAVAWRPGDVLAGPAPPLAVLVPRFSALALAAIGLVGLTGLYAEWAQLGALPTPDDPWGRALLAKLAIVVAALAVGLVNHLDGGRRAERLGGLRLRLGIESGLALAVLAASALLSTTPPAADRGIALEPRPSALGDVQRAIGLAVVPGRPGVNQLAVDLQGSIGDLPLDLVVTRVETGDETRISLAGTAPGSEPVDHTAHAAPPPTSGIERYVADALVLPAGSRWDVSVVIGDGSGGELIRQRFTFAMGEERLSEGAAATLADGALIAGLLLLVGGMLGIGLGIGGWTLPRCEATASRLALLGGGALAAASGLAIGVGRLVGVA